LNFETIINASRSAFVCLDHSLICHKPKYPYQSLSNTPMQLFDMVCADARIAFRFYITAKQVSC